MIRRESALVALVGLTVYTVLCPPASGMGDSSEFALVLATNGVAHPTGYPLYTLFGHGFGVGLHALGVPWSFAAGLWSAVGGALALYFLHALGTDLIDEEQRVGRGTRFLAALVPVSLFAFQPVVLGEATRAEVNAWGLAWACGAAFAFVRLVVAIRAGRAASPPRARRGAALWGLLIGVGLAHHLTSALISVPLTAALIAILARRREFSAGLLPAAAAAGLLPVATYGIIAWRAWHPARVQWEWLEPGFAGVIAHVTGEQYRQFVGSFAPSPFQKELLASVVYPFLFPGLALLLFGALRAKAERRIEWSALLAAAALVTIFTFRYGVPDPAPYFLPALALGVAAAAPAIATIPRVGTRPGTVALGATCMAGLFLIVPWLEDGRQERVATMEFERTIRSMWSAVPADTAIVSWTDDRFMRLVEYQVLRGEKPALVIFTPDMLYATPMRRRIRERFGVDPLEGFVESPQLPARSPAQEKAIIAESRQRLVRHLNERIRVPVILFDPTVPIVWQMSKPWEPAEEPPRPLPSTFHRTHPPRRATAR